MLTSAVALKENTLQLIADPSGDVLPDETGYGLYQDDTRFLSRLELEVNGWKPLPLSHSTSKHYIATYQLINPAFALPDGSTVRRQTVSIRRARFVDGVALYERIGILNCNQIPLDLEVTLKIDADFRDMFAVRGFAPQAAHDVRVTSDTECVHFEAEGRDGIRRATDVTFDRVPERVRDREVTFSLTLRPQEIRSIVVRVQPREGESGADAVGFDEALERLAESYRAWDDGSTLILTDNEAFDQEMLRASHYDVRTLLEETTCGLVPDAGVPWYAVPFGRDAIITALQTLPYNPTIAEGTLRFLAGHLGTEVDLFREEEPGKVMHELRRGELARIGEVPHSPYYGTVDATPLFLFLLRETFRWTGSRSLLDEVWPAALRAVEWIDRYGDVDGDGFVEYEAHRAGGVVNHGWKDSVDAVQYRDGTRAIQPIALVEVQGYVYAAKTGLAELARERGDESLAVHLERQAAALKERFNRAFWMPEDKYYALALDGNKRLVPSVASNAGHCLGTGICDDDKAAAVADRLLAPDMYSGWGVRTLSSLSPNYNPMSYHNGSVWPHDTALIALGLRRIGRAEAAAELVQGLIEAGFRLQEGRLPELFCGFGRDKRFNSRPAAYVVSCSPQAWSAGATYMLLQALLDLQPDPVSGTVRVDPILPPLFNRIEMRGLRVGAERVDLMVQRNGHDVVVQVLVPAS